MKCISWIRSSLASLKYCYNDRIPLTHRSDVGVGRGSLELAVDLFVADLRHLAALHEEGVAPLLDDEI